MSANRVFFMVLYGLLALLGVILAAAARDVGISLFGWGLVAFGVLNAFNTIKVHFDEAEGRH
ncbi:hypothetical protein GXW77_06935 [Roseomonas alkaliterrae]|jgi:hypothetical protein|uniref:Putative outer membrane lipoprotein n=1 Tax=Neoroseomonas alkaliterrae TaxID=1452450 RepID=A0A840XP41_9PROT|nr:hypothetical protein [Neoroseomonas alkaliterrae]MBB5690325.1 putative outer membrane lipoprotein [Neoroseomonas alkaliterrae]MBR0675910.1 hypothetical protein [Neoroseomonas alkaliterrae]